MKGRDVMGRGGRVGELKEDCGVHVRMGAVVLGKHAGTEGYKGGVSRRSGLEGGGWAEEG